MRCTPASIGVLVTMMLATGCALNPVTGNRELALVSEAQEIDMGRQGSADVIATIGLYPDDGLQTYVNRIGQSLAAGTERSQLDWEFHLLDDASVNAFALPGGFIFITRGLFTHMTNEAELASVLGHEIGHVTARHSVQQMSRQQLASLGLGIGSVLSPTVADYSQVASAGLGLLFLKYSRDDETQADRVGFRYALADGYDTREMMSVFEMLRRDAQLSGVGRLPEWQTTHPDPGNRITAVQDLVNASNANFASKKVARDEFLRRVDGVVYGEDPRAGYFRGSRFTHPGLAFVLTFPDGWATQNATDAVTAISPARDAVVQLRGAQGTAADAADRFIRQEGLQAGTPTSATIHGNRAVAVEFTAQSDQASSIRGVVSFIEYGGATWGIMGYSVAEKFSAYSSDFRRSTNSFERLTDPAALAVQPMRVRLEQAPSAISLERFNVQSPSSIPLAELALINGLDESAQLRPGQLIKRVTGTPPPGLASR